MKAVYITDFTGSEGLEIKEVPDPSPKENEVLVQVRAAGLNRADLLQARGAYPPPEGYSPNIPGLEFAGEVIATGGLVTRWTIGERVFGIAAGEAQAEVIVCDEKLLTRIPDNLSFVEAAAVPEAFITAYDAIFTLADLKASETLLIHAIGSGVGLAALQIAKAKGAFVIGTSRTSDKVVRCKEEYGLDIGLVIHDPKSFAGAISGCSKERGADVILDLVGGEYFPENLASLAPKGRLVLVGLTSGRTTEVNLALVLQKRARIIGTVLRPRPLAEKADATKKFANDVLPLLASGAVRPNLDRVFPVKDVVAAYKYLESNKSFGKVVLEF